MEKRLKIEIHADDEMGAKANAAALASHLLQFRLLGAASARMTREKRAQVLEQALTQWPALCRAMSELEAAAPNIAAKARDNAQRLRHIAERAA